MKWLNEQEIEDLKKMWENSTSEEIRKHFPTRNYESLSKRARELGLESNFKKQCKTDASKLLNNTNESWYWLGFILADGSVSSANRISVAISIKDLEHLNKFATYMKLSVKTYEGNTTFGKCKTCQVSVADKKTADGIKHLFSMGVNKTYSPPTLPKMSDDQFLSLLCGYIDGDGCINIQKGGTYVNKKGELKQYTRTDPIMQVKCHGSWEKVLKQFGERLCSILDEEVSKSKLRINATGYLVWRIYGNTFLKKFKTKLDDLDIPKMERKWSKIKCT